MFNKYALTILLVLFLLVNLLQAQIMIKRNEAGGEGVFILKEVGAIIMAEKGVVTVENLLPEKNRPKGYEEIDLKEGDKILMFNAERVKTIKDLQDKYEGLKIGEPVKLGIQRGKEMFIISFDKIDPVKLPKNRKIMIRAAEPGSEGSEGEGNVVIREIKIDNPDGKVKPLVGAGLILEETDDFVKISYVLPNMKDALGDVDVQEADVVVELNGNSVPTLKVFNKNYDKIQTGEKIRLKMKRKDKVFTVSLKKPGEKDRVIIKK